MSYIYDEVSPHDMMRRAEEFDRDEQLGGYAGIHALHEHLTEIAEEIGPIELDIVALCCEWSHYDTLQDAAEELIDPDERFDDEEAILDWFRDRTTVLELDNDAGYLIGEF